MFRGVFITKSWGGKVVAQVESFNLDQDENFLFLMSPSEKSLEDCQEYFSDFGKTYHPSKKVHLAILEK
jgi:hypothetical protein